MTISLGEPICCIEVADTFNCAGKNRYVFVHARVYVCVFLVVTREGKNNIKEGDPHGSMAPVVAWGAIKNQASSQGTCLLSCLAPTGVAFEGLAWARTSRGVGLM